MLSLMNFRLATHLVTTPLPVLMPGLILTRMMSSFIFLLVRKENNYSEIGAATSFRILKLASLEENKSILIDVANGIGE